MEYYYYAPLPIGLIVALIIWCFKMAANDNENESSCCKPRRRVIIIRRTNTQTTIPPQFESGTSPIIPSDEDDDDQQLNDLPPAYGDAQTHHQWQQQQGSQHPSSHGVQGSNQQQYGYVTGATPAQLNPSSPGQPGVVAAGYNGAGSSEVVLDVTGLPSVGAECPPSQTAPSITAINES